MLFNDPLALFTSQSVNRAFLPSADVAVSETDLLLTMDVPGFTADELSIDVQDSVLTIRGERKRPELGDNTTLVLAERAYGSFERRIQVPRGIETDHITASLDNGVLSLLIPKPARMQPKAISITTGSEQRRLETANA